MNKTWLYGITGIGFLVLAYLFSTKDAVLSGLVFAILGIVYLVATYQTSQKK